MIKKVSFGYLNAQMVRLHKALLADKLDELGINYGEVGFLIQTLRHPGRSQESLSVVLGVDKGFAARAIARLEKNGFLFRKENAENRREKLVYPTDKTKEIGEKLHAELMSTNDTMLSDLDDEERDMMMKFMRRVIDTCRHKLDMPSVWDLI